VSTTAPLPFGTRIWFAWACFFRVLFDGLFAARVFDVREALPAAPAAPAAAPAPAKAPEPPPVTSALQLLALLQREGRFVDFVEEDVASRTDAEIGAVARVVHEGCRKALHAHATIAPVRSEAEGSSLVLPAGFSPEEVKLVGDVKGSAPYNGVLRHRGWRAEKLTLPAPALDHDARVLAPAEVEL
jgi:hypothetical protein